MRNKIIYSFVIVMIICLMQSCATISMRRISASAGAQRSSIVGESDSWTGAFGFQGGLAYNVFDRPLRRISVQAEANISMLGANYEDDWGDGPVNGLTRLTYANLPLVLRYQMDNGFFGEAGIQPGLLLSAKDKLNGESYDYSDWVNKFDFGIPLGVGYMVNNNFRIGLRAIPGITNINSGDNNISKDRNLVVAIRGTYSFGKK